MTRWLNIIDTRYISEMGTVLYLGPVQKQHKSFMFWCTHKICREKPKDRGQALIGVLAGGEGRGVGNEPLSCTILEAAKGMPYRLTR